jgi:phage gpG-like protein
MAVGVNITVTVSPDLVRALNALRDPEPIFRRYLPAAARVIQSTARDRYLRGPRPGKLGVRTGSLLRSIGIDQSDIPRSVTVGTPLIYGPVHEFGATIRARGTGRMIFRVGDTGRGEFRSAKQVRLPARPFLGPSLEDNVEPLESLLFDEVKRATIE